MNHAAQRLYVGQLHLAVHKAEQGGVRSVAHIDLVEPRRSVQADYGLGFTHHEMNLHRT